MTPATPSTERARRASATIPRVLAVLVVLGAAALGAVSVPSCANPVQDQAIAALGGELSGVPPGPFHRPGQPCVVCHSENGTTKLQMVLGGTVFADLTSFKGVTDVDVVFTDSIGQTMTTTTNCVGNFYISSNSWSPKFPLAVEVRFPVFNMDGTEQMQSDGNGGMKLVQKVKAMGSVISRDGSCADCHKLTGRAPRTDASGTIIGYESTGWIYCNAVGDTNYFPDNSLTCPGKPPPFTGGTSSTTGASSSSSTSATSSSASSTSSTGAGG